MKAKNIIIKSLVITAVALFGCDPEYPMPVSTNPYSAVTGFAGFMLVNVSQNSSPLTLSVDNGEKIVATEVEYTERYPASNGYNTNTIRAGSRNIRIIQADTSLVSLRSNLNSGSSNSYYVIGRANIPTTSTRGDRARLIESLGESLPAIPVGLNTTHVRLLNFGLTASTLGSIALRIDPTSPTAAPALPGPTTTATTSTYLLPADQVFPIPAPAVGAVDLRSIPKSYASTTSPFTSYTVPVVGGAGNNYVVDVVTSSNGNVVLDNVALNLVSGRVYTLALIGSNQGGEQPYQLLVIRHR
jgi:hypothetical protein